MESLLDSMQVEVKVLSETSDECDDLIDVILEVNFSLVLERNDSIGVITELNLWEVFLEGRWLLLIKVAHNN